MRQQFADILLERMNQDKRIILVTADLGYKLFDKIRELPNQFYNVGAAEQCMLGVAVGLALEGKIPFCYTITPFFWRAAETIRNYINREKIPVKMIGSGRGKDYLHDGFSHDATDDYWLMDCFNNIICRWPVRPEELNGLVDNMIKDNNPYYLNLKR